MIISNIITYRFGDGRRGGRVVTGHHNNLDARRAHFTNGIRDRGFRRVDHRGDTQYSVAVDREVDLDGAEPVARRELLCGEAGIGERNHGFPQPRQLVDCVVEGVLVVLVDRPLLPVH